MRELRAEGGKPFLHSLNSHQALAWVSTGDRKCLECGVIQAGANPSPQDRGKSLRASFNPHRGPMKQEMSWFHFSGEGMEAQREVK